MEKYIKLNKIGNFYQAIDEDALILWYVFKYKYKNEKVGFPIKTLDKVKNKLEELHIHYKIDEKYIFNKGYNEYEKYLKKANELYKKYDKKEDILDKLEYLSENKLDKIIKYIEEQ